MITLHTFTQRHPCVPLISEPSCVLAKLTFVRFFFKIAKRRER
jgi:hypothetical protein